MKMLRALKSSVPIERDELIRLSKQYDKIVFVSDKYLAFNEKVFVQDLLAELPDLAEKIINEESLDKRYNVTNYAEDDFYKRLTSAFGTIALTLLHNEIAEEDQKFHEILLEKNINPKNIHSYLNSVSLALANMNEKSQVTQDTHITLNLQQLQPIINAASNIANLHIYFREVSQDRIEDSQDRTEDSQDRTEVSQYRTEFSQDRIKAFRLKTISNVCFALAILLIAPAFALVPEFQSDPDYPKDYCEILFGIIIGLIVTGLVVNVSVKFKLSKIDGDQASVINCGEGNGRSASFGLTNRP